MDERLMGAELGAEFSNGFFAGKAVRATLPLNAGSMILSFGHLCSPPGVE